MANPLRGSVSLPVGDRTFTMSFSINALCVLEDELGAPIGKVAEGLNDQANIRMSTVRTIVWAGLQDHHPEIDLHAAGGIMTEATVPVCMEAIGEAFKLAFPEGEKRGNPRKARASRR